MSCNPHWWRFTQKQKQEKFVLRIFIDFAFGSIETYRKTIKTYRIIGAYWGFALYLLLRYNSDFILYDFYTGKPVEYRLNTDF